MKKLQGHHPPAAQADFKWHVGSPGRYLRCKGILEGPLNFLARLRAHEPLPEWPQVTSAFFARRHRDADNARAGHAVVPCPALRVPQR
jgi:hypothetical protein